MRAASQLRIVCHAIVAVTLCGIGTPSAVAKLKVDPAKAATLHIPKGYASAAMAFPLAVAAPTLRPRSKRLAPANAAPCTL